MRMNLLDDPLIQTDQGWFDLPGLLAAMTRGEVAVFSALRPHQRPALHMFLVQLAVLALDAVDRRALPETEEEWRAALRGLTSAFPDDEPWRLVGTDRKRPAFLQPPDPEGLKWTEVATPDALDMPITSDNHDVKREIAQKAAAQDWIFALISLQTMEGYGGRDNNGIVRMKTGASSRVLMGLAPGRESSAEVDPSAWWARDVRRLLAKREGLQGEALLWLKPWAEGASLDPAKLDPLFIEICRRIRMVERGGRIFAERSTSKSARVAGKELGGNTGDPWAPINIVEGKSLTLGDRDWSYRLVTQLLYGQPDDKKGWMQNWKLPFLATSAPEEEGLPMSLILEAFARGKDGKTRTDGFQSRVIPIPKAMVAEMLGERPVALAEELLKDVAETDRILFDALTVVAISGNDAGEEGKVRKKNKKLDKHHQAHSAPAREALRRSVDAIFFEELWRRLEIVDDEGFRQARLLFFEKLQDFAQVEFKAALSGIPCASVMRPRAEARGESAFRLGFSKAMKKLEAPEAADA